MNDTIADGVWPTMVTPFTDTDRIDENALAAFPDCAGNRERATVRDSGFTRRSSGGRFIAVENSIFFQEPLFEIFHSFQISKGLMKNYT